MDVVKLWRELDNLNPMPISRSRDRIRGWLWECKALGLITQAEWAALVESDDKDRGL